MFHYDQNPKNKANKAFFHIAGLSIDAFGSPLRWFTTNRWVTGERLCTARHIEKVLPYFQIQSHGRLSPIANWLSAMVRLFSSDIASILYARDSLLKERFAHTKRMIVLEDRTLDIVSECRISLSTRIQQFSS